MELRDRLYEIIKQKGLKQYRIAETAGIKPSKFNNMLRGHALIKAEDIPPLCKALGVTPNDLFN